MLLALKHLWLFPMQWVWSIALPDMFGHVFFKLCLTFSRTLSAVSSFATGISSSATHRWSGILKAIVLILNVYSNILLEKQIFQSPWNVYGPSCRTSQRPNHRKFSERPRDFSQTTFKHIDKRSQFTGQQGKGEAISLTLLYHFHPLHRNINNSREIAAGSSPLPIASSRTRTNNFWFPGASH